MHKCKDVPLTIGGVCIYSSCIYYMKMVSWLHQDTTTQCNCPSYDPLKYSMSGEKYTNKIIAALTQKPPLMACRNDSMMAVRSPRAPGLGELEFASNPAASPTCAPISSSPAVRSVTLPVLPQQRPVAPFPAPDPVRLALYCSRKATWQRQGAAARWLTNCTKIGPENSREHSMTSLHALALVQYPTDITAYCTATDFPIACRNASRILRRVG